MADGRTVIVVEDGEVMSIFSDRPAQDFEVIYVETLREQSDESDPVRAILTETVLALPLAEAGDELDDLVAEAEERVSNLRGLRDRLDVPAEE